MKEEIEEKRGQKNGWEEHDDAGGDGSGRRRWRCIVKGG